MTNEARIEWRDASPARQPAKPTELAPHRTGAPVNPVVLALVVALQDIERLNAARNMANMNGLSA